MPRLNEFQQTFCLSLASNLASNQKVTVTGSDARAAAAKAEALISSKLTVLLNDLLAVLNPLSGTQWAIDWGPGVYVVPPATAATDDQYELTATNVEIVFKDGSGQTDSYVVSIAGTNGASDFDVLVENLATTRVMSWRYGQPGEASVKVSSGTTASLEILIDQINVNGQSLASYFAAKTEKNATVTFTGHSLGGALAPALALAMCNQDSPIDSSLPAKVRDLGWTARHYPTAAPDIGNQAYAAFLSETFPPAKVDEPITNFSSTLQQWNQKLWNPLDVVPQVWSEQFIAVISTIYGSDLATPDYVNCIVTRALSAIRDLNGGSNPFWPLDPDRNGQFQRMPYIAPSGCDDCTGDEHSLPDGLCDFVSEMLAQHGSAYISYFGIPQAIATLIPLPPTCPAAEALYDDDLMGCRSRSTGNSTKLGGV
ncbi:MAG: hypothetical protein AAF560_07105 [Acidobacteriota bacterium]